LKDFREKDFKKVLVNFVLKFEEPAMGYGRIREMVVQVGFYFK